MLCLWVAPAMAEYVEPAKVATTQGPPIATPELAVATSDLLRGIGSDGGEGVWFSEEASTDTTAYLTHYTPSQAGTTRPVIKSGTNYEEYIKGIAPGPLGNEWFSRFYDNEISHITASGTLVNKKLPAKNFSSEPESLVVDSQGNVWFIMRGHSCRLGRLSSAGKFSEYGAISNDCGQLTIGPDGNIWVAGDSAGYVAEVSATTGAVLARYENLGLPVGIATVGDAVFVTEDSGGVAMITPSGDVTEFLLPGQRSTEWATAGPDGAFWFMENEGPTGTSAIGRLTPTGELSELPVPGGGGIADITATEHAIYFTYDNGTQPGVYRIPLAGFVAPQPSYVALGDSYSSGEGNPPYEAGTDDEGAPDLCHRSNTAYGPLLDTALTLGPMTFKACSGAVTNDVFSANHQYPSEGSQLSHLRASTKTVTLTIGGDDAGFGWVLSHCVNTEPPVHPGYGCSKDKSLEAETQARLAALNGGQYATTPPPASQPIHSILSVIQGIHNAASSARIGVGLYPMLFGKNAANYPIELDAPSGSACEVGNQFGFGLWIDYKNAQWLNRRGAQLNSIISQAVKTAVSEGINAIAVTPSGFKRHGFCDELERWFYPLELQSDPTATEVSAKPSSFHPNTTGQRGGYEAAFAAKLK